LDTTAAAGKSAVEVISMPGGHHVIIHIRIVLLGRGSYIGDAPLHLIDLPTSRTRATNSADIPIFDLAIMLSQSLYHTYIQYNNFDRERLGGAGVYIFRPVGI
jgi:hypothetical protein